MPTARRAVATASVATADISSEAAPSTLGAQPAAATSRPSWYWSREDRRANRGGEELVRALQLHGFIGVELEDLEVEILAEALAAFADEKSFRFPPVPGEVADCDDAAASPGMPRPFAACFDALYGISCRAAKLMRGDNGLPPSTPPCGDGRLGPFERSGGPWPYGASFFNIFNYDHGCLNTHRDRGVLTVVYGAPSQEGSSEGATRLWLRTSGPDGQRWVAPAPGELLLWAGEGLEAQGLEAIEHSVRVDPEGPYIEHSHSRRDPEAPASGNRRSVAFVLDE